MSGEKLCIQTYTQKQTSICFSRREILLDYVYLQKLFTCLHVSNRFNKVDDKHFLFQ